MSGALAFLHILTENLNPSFLGVFFTLIPVKKTDNVLPGIGDHALWCPCYQRCKRKSCPGNCCCHLLDGAGSISQTSSPGPGCSIQKKTVKVMKCTELQCPSVKLQTGCWFVVRSEQQQQRVTGLSRTDRMSVSFCVLLLLFTENIFYLVMYQILFAGDHSFLKQILVKTK